MSKTQVSMRCLQQAEPLANVDELLVMPAPEELDLMIILHGRFDLHPKHGSIRMSLLDLSSGNSL